MKKIVKYILDCIVTTIVLVIVILTALTLYGIIQGWIDKI